MNIPNRLAIGVLAGVALLGELQGHSLAQTPGSSSATPASPSFVASGASAFEPGKSLPASPESSLTGPNFSLNGTSQHDASTGWSNVLTPALSFRFNPHILVNTNFPWYLSLEASVPTTVNGVTSYQLQQVHNVLGDTTASAHFDSTAGDFGYNAVFTVGFPTGDRSLGISAGTTTYHLNNHFEYSLGPVTPDIEAGIGNSSALTSHSVRKAYTAVGTIANFQAGANIDLPRKLSLDVEFYEAMPFAAQDVFGTIGRHGKGQGKKVLQGAGSAEDNGITAELGIPLTRRLTLSGDYNRSIIQADDIVGLSLTWQLRAPKRVEAGTPSSPLSRFNK
jgi:hypothetical protein